MVAATPPARLAAGTRRHLLPREHGAWVQLLLPLLTALALGRPTLPAGLLATAALLAFLAHEPLLVATGRRGRRLRALHGGDAGRRAAGLGAVAALAGLAGLVLAPAGVATAAGVALGLAAGLAWLVRAGLEKTLAGEVLAAAALASTAVPVALAAGVPASAAWTSFAVWAVGFGLATGAVHLLKARHRGQVGRTTGPAFATVALAAPLALVAADPGGLAAAGAAVLPLAGLAALLAVLPLSPRRMMAVGVLLAVAAVATAALSIALLR